MTIFDKAERCRLQILLALEQEERCDLSQSS